jgi:hypothetical protein
VERRANREAASSAARTIVAYAMGITDLDPIPHGLMFERFLNPERVSMPDVDIDFDERHLLGDVVQHIQRDRRGQLIEGGARVGLGEQVAAPGEDAVAVDGFIEPGHVTQPGQLLLTQPGCTLQAGVEPGAGRMQGHAYLGRGSTLERVGAAEQLNTGQYRASRAAAENEPQAVVDGASEGRVVGAPLVQRLHGRRKFPRPLLV